jgi:xanthine/CO dehydrogenase XdhC/CoxF family maturation factor
MSNQLSNLLRIWFKSKNNTQWVLGTVYKTQGSAYRKAGSYMLINGDGQQFGLLSGGCLEADIVLNSRKVMESEKSVLLVYDSNDEDDITFQFGLGCGGKVYVMLQLVTAKNDLDLYKVHELLQNRKTGTYYQKIGGNHSYVKKKASFSTRFSQIKLIDGEEWLITKILPEPHLLVVGGGVDAIPVVNIAKELGWIVTLVDPRVANARKEKFPFVDFILKKLT